MLSQFTCGICCWVVLTAAALSAREGDIYTGELISQDQDRIVLVQEPCDSRRKKVTIPHSRVTDLGMASCPDGRKYHQVQVEELAAPPGKTGLIGELVSQDQNAIVIREHPCDSQAKTVTIVHYRVNDLGMTSCPDGKKYRQVQVEEIPPQPPPPPGGLSGGSEENRLKVISHSGTV
jgi:Cu/Ag efflux protein CusF